MALKVRVMASQVPVRGGGVPGLLYRAEAYEEADRFRERKWECSHNHRSVEDAFNCGVTWLNERSDGPVEESA